MIIEVYIDDIFLVYQHGLDNLKELVNTFNASHATLKLTLDWSHTEVAFLDTLVYKSDNKLRTKLYRKPTDATNYLMHHSAHPPGCKKGFKSQAMRVRRNCADIAHYDEFIEPLKQAYKDRGYRPEHALTETVRDMRSTNRDQLLQTREKHTKCDNVVCTLPYNLKDIPARHIILKYWHILKESQSIGHLFTNNPIFGYFRPKNFRDQLCMAKVIYPPNRSAIKGAPLALYSDECDVKNCKNCPLLTKNNHFTSSQTHLKYRKSFKSVECETKNVVYLLTCNKCKSQLSVKLRGRP